MLTKSQSSIMPPARLLPADVIWERYYMRDEVGPAPRAPFDPTRGFLVGGYTSNPQPCWLGSSGQGLQRSAAQPCVLGPISPGQALQRSATLQPCVLGSSGLGERSAAYTFPLGYMSPGQALQSSAASPCVLGSTSPGQVVQRSACRDQLPSQARQTWVSLPSQAKAHLG